MNWIEHWRENMQICVLNTQIHTYKNMQICNNMKICNNAHVCNYMHQTTSHKPGKNVNLQIYKWNYAQTTIRSYIYTTKL
jgi:hypothetical protein